MPHPNVTVYDLLLSCPGDVLDLKSIIEECITAFNNTLGTLNNIRVDLKHWSTDSFSQSGGKPQKLLNKQFVNDCDLCVALIGTRFGTPTDNYDSGTEEEIEIMLSHGKQVFLYFIERQVDHSTLDTDQLCKVKNFKDRYASKGIYSIIKSKEQLRKEFQNAIFLYFLNTVSSVASEVLPAFVPNLLITAEDNESDAVFLCNNGYQNIGIVKDKEKRICNLIAAIDDFIIVPSETQEELDTPKLTVEEKESMTVGDIMKAMANGSISKAEYCAMLGQEPPVRKKVELFSKYIDLVEAFCTSKGITISEKFWYLGNLHQEISSPVLNIMNINAIEYIGSDSEKEKHGLIKELIEKIEDYNDAEEFFSWMSSLYKTSLVISNVGTTFDEDIDVRIYIEKGHLVSTENLPVPGMSFIEELVDAEAPAHLFAGHSTANVEAYSSYPVHPYVPCLIELPFKSREKELEKCKQKYRDLLNDIFCYTVHHTNEDDILCFNVPYLKQHTVMHFPSYLFFESIPQYIRYEIRSKHSPNVYTKKFEVRRYE